MLVLIAATLLLVSLTVALPRVYQEGQREREEELIFRGTQYARAIVRFHQKFQRFPTKVEELTKLTNGMRFLRKEYADPMTPKGNWRFIHANALGVLVDSKTTGQGAMGQGQPGANQGTGGFGSSGQSSVGTGGFVGQGMSGGGFGQSSGGFSLDSNSNGSTSGSEGNSSFFGQSSQGGGLFIVGVASTSRKESIRIWNQKTRYDEWEFLGTDSGSLGLGNATPGVSQGGGGQPGLGGQPGMLGQPPQGNPKMPAEPQSMFPPSGGSGSSQQ